MKPDVFNIIYIADTVDYQSIALLSLLQNTSFNFRLVGNALSAAEFHRLENIAGCSERLEAINFESDQIIPHGTVVNMLHAMCETELLCFMDSDVFIFHNIDSSAAQLIGGHQVFSTGGRIENDNDATYTGFKGGASTVSPDGSISLATTFFCIYQQHAIKKCLSTYHVGFEQYRSEQQIPKPALEVVKHRQLQYEMFDTGKLLGVLFAELGYSKLYRDIEGLVHIGGMSGRYLQSLDLQQQQSIVDENDLASDHREGPSNENSEPDNALRQRTEKDIRLKRLLGTYFYCFLHHLIGKGKMPKLITQDHSIEQLVVDLSKHIKQVLQQAGNSVEQKNILKIIRGGG